jgi:hypothetical protein
MKRKLVFWRKTTGDLTNDNFSEKPQYHAFFTKCNLEFDFRIASNSDAYLKNGIFKNVSKYENWKIVAAENKFKTDVIYQREILTTNNFDRAVPIIDTPEFKEWCRDKWNQYLSLKKYMPKTFLIQTQEDFLSNLEKITTNKAVVKPRRGKEGRNITIFEKKNPPVLNSEILTGTGYLLQEYANTDVDLKNIVTGIHDIKLITAENQIFANLRTPEPGKDYCTYDSPYSEIPRQLLPQSIINLHREVMVKVNELYPQNFYTVDVGMTTEGPVIFELNGHTAFPYLHFSYADEFFNVIIKKLQSLQ